MSKIKRLPLHEAQKIAAGEVVDRPANVVKELVENALDAGSTSISVYIEQAGKKLIRVVDNGCGMEEDDALLCFEQHATSKITSVEELQSISTFGFRGEALASIASVSTVNLTTKIAQADHGIALTLNHGSLVNQDIAAGTTGTDIAVHNLFENVPARKKFLKTNDTEWRAILHLMHAFCLDYANVHVKLFHDSRQIFNCPRTDSLEHRIAQLWDSSLSQAMLPFQATSQDKTITIRGVISHHQYYRYDRSCMYIFVNNRWVKNHQLSNAVIKSYQNVLPQGRYPACCLYIDIDQTQVDINIHPRKEEVLFLHPMRVTNLIQNTLKKTLEDHLSSHLKKPISLAISKTTESRFNSQPHFTPFDFDHFVKTQHNTQPELTTPSIVQQHSKITSPSPQMVQQAFDDKPLEPAQNYEQQELATTHNNHTIIGHYNNTYILVEHPNGLFMVDQHAAHERILYELFKHRFDQVATINLLFPLIIPLTEHEVTVIEHHAELFQEHGISVARFSVNQIIVESTPVHVKDMALDDLFKQTVSWLEETQYLDKNQLFNVVHEKLHAQMACKAAVKAGDVLTHEKMQQLIHDLDNTQNKLTCPHGRPTGWLLSLYDIEKKFKR